MSMGAGDHTKVTCKLLTLEFHPLKGSVVACESCKSQKLIKNIWDPPKRCWNSACAKPFEFCERGFPIGLLEQSREFINRGLRSAEATS